MGTMMNVKPELEIRRFLRESWSMGWPMILIMFFTFSIGIADVYVAGFLGTEILAAVGYVGQLYWTLMILANGVTVGTVSMVSQAYGAKCPEGVGSITAHSLALGVLISGVLTVLAQLYPGAIVRIAGMPQGIQSIAEAFLRVFSLVLIPTYLMIITGGVLRASGRVRLAMANSFVAAVVNVAGDFVLSFGWGPIPALGYVGIAWATAIATTIGMSLNLAYMFSGPERLSLASFGGPLPRCIKSLVKLGVPTALQQTAWNAGTLVVYFLAGQLEAGQITALAAMTAGVRVEAIIFLPVFALNMASAVLTGNRLGAGDVTGARSGAKATALLCLGIIILPALAIFTFAPYISDFLTEDPAVRAEMTTYLRVNMIGVPFLAVGVTLSGALQGAGDTFGTMKIIFAGMWIFRIPLILVVIHILYAGALGIWWSMTISMILMCSLLAHRFRGDKWIRASIDKETKTMLWEACLPDGGASTVCVDKSDNQLR
jgi:multidrug resistance protein, MATE family